LVSKKEDIIMTEMIPKSSEKITCECGYVLSKGNLARHKLLAQRCYNL